MSNFFKCKFKHFTFNDYNKIMIFYKFMDNRFYKSLMYLTQSKKFIYTIYRDCLVVLKRGHIMNNKYVYLMFPPIHRVGDMSISKAVFKELTDLGIKTKLLNQEFRSYGLNGSNVIIDTGNDEFVYHTKNILEMRGKSWGRVRSYINKNNKLVESGNLRYFTVQRINPLIMKRMLRVTKYWIKYHKNMKSILHFINNVNEFKHAYITWVENQEGSILGYMISEDYGNEIILTMPVKNYELNWKYDINAYVMNKTAEFWFGKKSNHITMNIGASVGDKGLHRNKNKYEPYSINQMYNTIINKKVDIYNKINI